VIRDAAIGREKPFCLPSQLKPLHPALPLSHRFGLPSSSGAVGLFVQDGPLVDGGYDLWRLWPVAEGALGPDGVVVAAPLFE